MGGGADRPDPPGGMRTAHEPRVQTVIARGHVGDISPPATQDGGILQPWQRSSRPAAWLVCGHDAAPVAFSARGSNARTLSRR